MRLSTATCIAVGAAYNAVAEECLYSLQVLQLQDASSSFKDDVIAMEALAAQLVGNITTLYPGSSYGLSSFIDKPVPLHGYGNYGGWGKGGANNREDYCFKSHLPFTDDDQKLSDALAEVAAGVGSGFDNQENQLEALLYAAQDTTLGWAPIGTTHDANGRPIVRLVIMITDAPPHLPGDLAGVTTYLWNWPRTYTPNVSTSASQGGFGADNFMEEYGAMDDQYAAQYAVLCSYYHKLDFGIALSPEEQSDFDHLISYLGPYPWPEFTTVHPGTVNQPCDSVEYPELATVGSVLQKYSVFPVFLIANPTVDNYLNKECTNRAFNPSNPDQLQACLVVMYQEYLGSLGVPGYVSSMAADTQEIVETIMDAISHVVQDVCIMTTTTSTSGSTVSTASSANGPTSSTSSTTSTTTVSTTPGGAAPIPPPPAPDAPAADGGSSTAIIAGAAAGGAAALAAAGFFAYKKWGAAGFTSNTTPDIEATQDVEIPDEPVERETIEEVTMDMFQ